MHQVLRTSNAVSRFDFMAVGAIEVFIWKYDMLGFVFSKSSSGITEKNGVRMEVGRPIICNNV